MKNKKRYISNSKCPMDTKLDRVVAYDMRPHSTNHITPSKNLFPFMNFFHLRIVPLILHTATIRLLLLVREKETLNEIHGSIWWLNFVSLPLSCKFSFFLLDFDLIE